MPQNHSRAFKYKGVRNIYTSLSTVKGLNFNRRLNRGLLNTTLASLRQYRNILVTQGGTRVLRLPTRRRVRQHIIRSYFFRYRVRHTTKDLKAVRAGRRQTTDLLSRQLELHMIGKLISQDRNINGNINRNLVLTTNSTRRNRQRFNNLNRQDKRKPRRPTNRATRQTTTSRSLLQVVTSLRRNQDTKNLRQNRLRVHQVRISTYDNLISPRARLINGVITSLNPNLIAIQFKSRVPKVHPTGRNISTLTNWQNLLGHPLRHNGKFVKAVRASGSIKLNYDFARFRPPYGQLQIGLEADVSFSSPLATRFIRSRRWASS